MVLLLVPYSRVLSYRLVKRAQLQAGGVHISQPTSFKSRVLLRSAGQAYPFPLHNIWQTLRNNIIREFRKEKNQYIGPLPHPLPSLVCRPHGSIWLDSVAPNYSTCISHNFFIFCPICLKFFTQLSTYILLHFKNTKIAEGLTIQVGRFP